MMNEPLDLIGRERLWEGLVEAQKGWSPVDEARGRAHRGSSGNRITTNTSLVGLERQVRVPLPDR